jgi:predicted aldo/keto reductase-like oxidoreductase
MIYRNYGKTGKKVSILGFGGMRFGRIDDREACVRMMVEAAQAGVNYFDTAPGYFGYKGEEVFGEGFAELRGKSLPYFSSTKTMQSTESGIRSELDGQLKRLGLSAVDFYHIWCVTGLEEWKKRKRDGVLQAFRKLKDEKLIRHIVVSSHLIGDGIKELLMEGVFEGVLFGYSAYNFNAREKAFDAITAHNLGCVVMNPLGGGIIPDNQTLFQFLRTSPDQTVVEAALNFLFSQEKITCSLVGFENSSQIRDAVKAVEKYKQIPSVEMERIKKSLSASFEDLCTGCGYCDSCPEGIPIPKLMDAYNHKKLYKTDKQLLDRLRWHWSVSPREADTCTQCARCEGLCTQHLPIMDRMAEISRIGGGKAD